MYKKQKKCIKLQNADCITNAILWTIDELAAKGIVMKHLVQSGIMICTIS